MGIGGSQVECRRKQNAREVEEGAATVKDLEEEPLNESSDCQTTIYISYADTIRLVMLSHDNTDSSKTAGRR